MRNVTHAISGGAAYAALGTYTWHQPPALLATGTAIAIGAATLPDLDQMGSAPARAFGWLTEALAWVVHKISGGHREGTHTAVGDAVCAGIALAALALERWPLTLHAGRVTAHTSVGMVVLIAYLALLFGAGSKALRLMRRHDFRREALALAAAAALALSGYDAHGIALAVLVGTVAHCLGDGLTDHGVAWLAPFTKRRFNLLPEPFSFTTGSKPEGLVMCALVLALGYLAWHAVMLPGFTK